MTNLEEFVAGADPTDFASQFVFKQVLPDAHAVSLRWHGKEGRAYSVYHREHITSGTWGEPLYTVDCLREGILEYTPQHEADSGYYLVTVIMTGE